MKTRSLTILAACAALLLAGCGEREEESEAPAQEATPTATAEAAISEDLTTKPAIPAPQGSPPAQLEVEDVVEGDGKRAKAGDQISVQYVGASWSTGQEFDSSWDRGAEPFVFQLGSGNVIPGWDQGLEGMRVGGRRKLTIPPDLGYGAQGSPPAIAPNETLVFVVDLLEIG
jgi:peptidylprolyl isomerase